MNKYLLLISVVACQVQATNITGKVVKLYTDDSGAMAIRLDNAVSASANAECPTNNGWMGVTDDRKDLKAALLAAKMAGAPVKLILAGCTAGDQWLKVRGIYIE